MQLGKRAEKRSLKKKKKLKKKNPPFLCNVWGASEADLTKLRQQAAIGG